jgi:hypothetical protein
LGISAGGFVGDDAEAVDFVFGKMVQEGPSVVVGHAGSFDAALADDGPSLLG